MGRFSNLIGSATSVKLVTGTTSNNTLPVSATGTSFEVTHPAVAAINTSVTINVSTADIASSSSNLIGSTLVQDDAPVKSKKLIVNKVHNTYSSISGANSSGFDIYRKARRHEQERLDSIEKQMKVEEESRALEERVQRNKREAEERTRKNAEKRKRKKMKRLSKSDDANNGRGASDSNQQAKEDEKDEGNDE